jgi:glycosyltransferase involved in cell wall biosynthesis
MIVPSVPIMKIAIIAEFPVGALDGPMVGRGGGQAATWLPQLAMAWQNQSEFEIHWCVLVHKVKIPRTIHKWGQTFHLIPSPGISASLLLDRWPQRLAYRKMFKKIKPDLVHCWGTENLHGAALLEFDGPSVLSMQGIIHTIYKIGDLKGWRWWLFKHWEPKTIRKASLITCESKWGLERLEEIIPCKPQRRIEYGVNPSYYDVARNPSSNAPEILFAGGLSRAKGVDILLEMLKRHPKRTWKLVIAGGGYLEESLRALNDPMVEVLGTIKTQELQARMARAWALVHPSRADTSPNVVKEARVIGLPIVGSPHGGHAEYIEHGKDGFIVESEDPEDWFNALESICSNYALCRTMGQQRNEFFREHFRPKNTAEGFLKLYRELLSPKPIF